MRPCFQKNGVKSILSMGRGIRIVKFIYVTVLDLWRTLRHEPEDFKKYMKERNDRCR